MYRFWAGKFIKFISSFRTTFKQLAMRRPGASFGWKSKGISWPPIMWKEKLLYSSGPLTVQIRAPLAPSIKMLEICPWCQQWLLRILILRSKIQKIIGSIFVCVDYTIYGYVAYAEKWQFITVLCFNFAFYFIQNSFFLFF